MFHTGPIAGIAAHGDHIATAGYDNKVILWNRHSRQAVARGTHDHLVNNCAFSSDGKWLLTASSDYSARLWALPAMRLQAVFADHADDVDMAVFSPDDQLVATCALDRKVRVYDINGHCLQTFSGHTGNVLALAWTSDGHYLVSTSVDGTVRQWDVVRGLETSKTDLRIRTDSLEIDAEGVIYAGDDLGRIAIIYSDRTEFVQAHLAGIKKVALNACGDTLVCLSYDRQMSVWRISPDCLPVEINRTELPENVWARAAVVLPDDKVATGTFGSSYAVFDLKTGKWDLQSVLPGLALNDVITVGTDVYAVGDAGIVLKNGLAISEMGSLCNFLLKSDHRLLTGGQVGTLLDADTAEVLFTHHSPLNCGAMVQHGLQRFVAIGTYTGEVMVFEEKGDGSLAFAKELKVYENAVKGLSFCNGLLFSVCASTDIAWHKVSDWTLVKEIDRAHDRIANDCCAIDSEHFATVSRDKTLRIWADKKTEIYPSPHPHSVKCISVSDDHKTLLTGCYGGTLAMFDLTSRKWTQVERPTMSGISAITWDATGRRFLAASYDGKIYPMQVSA
jgi:WD40 repeat protein